MIHRGIHGGGIEGVEQMMRQARNLHSSNGRPTAGSRHARRKFLFKDIVWIAIAIVLVGVFWTVAEIVVSLVRYS